jgi:hypothetical protein
MNRLNPTDPSRQSAQAFSERLGNLAAASSATRPTVVVPQLNAAVTPRLSAVLANFRQRAERRQEAADQLRAQEFMAP